MVIWLTLWARSWACFRASSRCWYTVQAIMPPQARQSMSTMETTSRSQIL